MHLDAKSDKKSQQIRCRQNVQVHGQKFKRKAELRNIQNWVFVNCKFYKILSILKGFYL